MADITDLSDTIRSKSRARDAILGDKKGEPPHNPAFGGLRIDIPFLRGMGHSGGRLARLAPAREIVTLRATETRSNVDREMFLDLEFDLLSLGTLEGVIGSQDDGEPSSDRLLYFEANRFIPAHPRWT